jgi:hypothetical protein
LGCEKSIKLKAQPIKEEIDGVFRSLRAHGLLNGSILLLWSRETARWSEECKRPGMITHFSTFSD